MPADVGQHATPVPGADRAGHISDVRRATWAGLIANLLLSALKMVCGVLGGSQAVVADSVHTMSDCSTDVAVLVGVRYWLKPPDAGHPHGHGRIETMVTILIGAVLAAAGIGLAWNALATMHGPETEPPKWIAFGAAVVSLIAKEALYRWTAAIGTRIKSPAVIANAWHHRSDGFSSIPAALAVAAARLNPSWTFVDHVGAVVVSLFILQAAWKIAAPSLGQLADRGASPDDTRRIVEIARAVPNVRSVHAVRTRNIGSGLQVDMHVLVDAGLTVREGHDIAGEVQRRLQAGGPDVADVIVHVEPFEEGVSGAAPVWASPSD